MVGYGAGETVFSTGMAGPRGDVCSLPHSGCDSIHLRIQLCLAQLFHLVMSEHSVQLCSSMDNCPGARGSTSHHRDPDVSPSIS